MSIIFRQVHSKCAPGDGRQGDEMMENTSRHEIPWRQNHSLQGHTRSTYIRVLGSLKQFFTAAVLCVHRCLNSPDERN